MNSRSCHIVVPLITAASFIAILAYPQILMRSESELLLPEEKMITGVVVDSVGDSIGKAYIEHAAAFDQARGRIWRRDYATDDTGKFSIRTSSPVLVFMKPGYRSIRVQTDAASDLRINLSAAPDQGPQLCPASAVCDSLPGGRFCFPKSKDVEATKPGSDVDYVARGYVIKTKDGRRGIRHGSGPMWSLGRPFNEDVWRSTDYEEVVYDDPLPMLTDARGKAPDGKLWRYVGTIGESADYSGMSPDAAAKLDRVLDAMCVLQKK